MNNLKSTIEDLESFISDNIMTNVQPASVSCQTRGEYLQEGQDFEIELNKKNKEIDRLEIKWKEEKVDVQKKDLIIGGINEKVRLNLYKYLQTYPSFIFHPSLRYKMIVWYFL